MYIYPKNFVSFKAISLNKDEKKHAENLLHSNDVSKEKVKLELFNIFDKHLQNEAKAKSRGLYKQEDFLQRLYLTFLESLENTKSLTVDKLLEILNGTKPNQEEIKEEYRYEIFSINKTLNNRENLTFERILSEDKVLKPKTQISQEERIKKQKRIQKLSESLTKKEQNLINKRSQGKTYKEIAGESEVSIQYIRTQVRGAIAKIQLTQDTLPEKYKSFANNFVKAFELNLSEKEALDFIINHIELAEHSIATLNSNIATSSQLLGIDRKLFTQAALKQPPLFSQKPETIFANVNTTSKLLNVDRKLFTQAALKTTQLFYQKPETIAANIDTTSKLLNVDRKLFTQVALKQPPLFCLKSETIAANVENSAKLLGIEQKLFTQAALKHPPLFCLKPETIVKKVNIVKYYKQIAGTQDDKIVFSSNSNKKLYHGILSYLVKKYDGLQKGLKEADLINYLKNQNKVYDFTIPKNNLADEFIKYVQDFSKSNFGKKIFNVVVK